MSLPMSKLAWESTEAEHGARLVLLALADIHNEKTGQCNPNVSTLMKRTRLGKTAVVKAIAELEALGIVIVDRKTGCGSWYRFTFRTGPDSEPVQESNPSEFRTQPVHIPNLTGSDSGPVTGKNRKEPVPPTPKWGECRQLLSLEPESEGGGIGFTEFWEAYPKKVAKKESMAIWRRMNPDEQTVRKIVASVEAMKATETWTKEGGRFVMAPDRFLRNERWNDAAPTPSKADAIAALEARVARHPGNPEWAGYDAETVTREQRVEFAQLKAELKRLSQPQSRAA